MATPVVGVSEEPRYGGLTGYKRPNLGKPTAPSSSLPAFRGKPNTPGDNIGVPAIRNSVNRQDRGTNVTIPYSRVVPAEELHSMGRTTPGHVLFVARTKCTAYGIAHATESRVVGVDWLTKELGGRPEYDGESYTTNWKVGYNVLLASDNDMSIGKAVCDEWRSLIILREWTCDGVCLSHDEPYAFTGDHRSQLFNIAIQGLANVKNGYSAFNGNNVESLHRGIANDSNGYHDGGEPLINRTFQTAFGDPYYPSFSQQMFSRKIRPLSEIFVGLVATKRRLTGGNTTRYKDQLLSTATTEEIKTEIGVADAFYSFHFCFFSSDQAWLRGQTDDEQSDERATKRAKLHYEEAEPGESYDPYVGISPREWHGMVGAWKIGKVLDTAAIAKPKYTQGPIDTSESVTVNVGIEWMDWRSLRRRLGKMDIGAGVPGAARWTTDMKDDGIVLQWPTEYDMTSSLKGVRDKSNQPRVDDALVDKKEDQEASYSNRLNAKTIRLGVKKTGTFEDPSRYGLYEIERTRSEPQQGAAGAVGADGADGAAEVSSAPFSASEVMAVVPEKSKKGGKKKAANAAANAVATTTEGDDAFKELPVLGSTVGLEPSKTGEIAAVVAAARNKTSPQVSPSMATVTNITEKESAANTADVFASIFGNPTEKSSSSGNDGNADGREMPPSPSESDSGSVRGARVRRPKDGR